MIRALAVATLLALSGCAGGGGKSAPPQTIADPIGYLAPAGPVEAVWYDFGHYQARYGFRLEGNRAVTAWDYAVFGTYAPAEGDGGEQYVLEGDTVRIEGTRDGGTPYDQHFVGKSCGGTGWVLFRTDATAAWRETVAHLGISADPSQCSAGSPALTRYSVQTVDFPVIGRRAAIVSEHYSTGSRDAPAMERSFFVRDLGRAAWQAFSALPPSLPADELARRCPDFGWQTAGALNLADCRISVHAEPAAISASDLWRLGR